MQSLSGATQAVILIAVHLPVVRTAPVSFINLHSLLPSFRFITPRSQLKICFNAWHTLLYSLSRLKCANSFRKPSLQYSLGFISLHSVIHSFQDYSIHPLYLLLRSPLRAPCCVTMLRWHKPWLITSLCHASHLHCLSITPFSRFTVQPAGAARKDNSFRSSLHCLLWLAVNQQYILIGF